MFKVFGQNTTQNDGPLRSQNIVALMNQKGGVGKTTMAYNVANAMNSMGKRVLCIDMDPQFNFSLLFGHNPKGQKNIYHLLVNSIRELRPIHTDTLLTDVLIQTESGIDILPAGQELSGFELTVAGINSPRQLILKKFIEKNNLDKSYDYIVIDGPPTLGLLVVNILCACRGVLFPFIPDAFSEQGLKNIQEVLLDIEDMGIVEAPKILGYIPNLFEGRRKKSREDFESICRDLKSGEIFSPFFNRAPLARSMGNKKSVFDFEASDYKELQGQFLTVAKSIETQLGL